GRRLVVSRDPAKGDFRRLRDALTKAQPKDHIVLADDVFEEWGAITTKSDITIEPEDGQEVVWRLPERMDAAKYLLGISSVARVHVRGLTLDGGNKVDQVILIGGRNPGITLEDLRIRGFKENGVLIVGCSGTPDSPVSLLHIETQTNTPASAGIAFR